MNDTNITNETKDKAARLIEHQQNLDEIEKRLAEVLAGPSPARYTVQILCGMVVIGSGSVLTATFSQNAPGQGSGQGSGAMGMISAMIMICAGLVILGAALGQMEMNRREKRLLRAVRHLLRQGA